MSYYYSSSGGSEHEEILSMRFCSPYVAILKVQYLSTGYNRMWLTLFDYGTGSEQYMYFDDDYFDTSTYPGQYGLFFSTDCNYVAVYFSQLFISGNTAWYRFKIDSSSGISFTAE